MIRSSSLQTQQMLTQDFGIYDAKYKQQQNNRTLIAHNAPTANEHQLYPLCYTSSTLMMFCCFQSPPNNRQTHHTPSSHSNSHHSPTPLFNSLSTLMCYAYNKYVLLYSMSNHVHHATTKHGRYSVLLNVGAVRVGLPEVTR